VLIKHAQGTTGSAYPQGTILGAPTVGDAGWNEKYQGDERFMLPALPVGPDTLVGSLKDTWLV
jgi:hypothetical protein